MSTENEPEPEVSAGDAPREKARNLDAIDLAQRANGGVEWKESFCRCDPDVGAVPCEYCAIHFALAIAHKAFSVGRW